MGIEEGLLALGEAVFGGGAGEALAADAVGTIGADTALAAGVADAAGIGAGAAGAGVGAGAIGGGFGEAGGGFGAGEISAGFGEAGSGINSAGVLSAAGPAAAVPSAVGAGDIATGTAGTNPALAGDVASAAGPGGGTSFLPVTGTGPGVSSLSADLAQSLGIGGDVGGAVPLATGAPDVAGGILDAGNIDAGIMGDSTGPLDKAGNWLGNHPAQAGLLGISGINALRQPQLPGAAKTALGSSTEAVKQAQSIINSGGTSSPQWAIQKGAIDQSIDQALRDATEQMVQQAANNGQGGRDSAVVQQQINRLNERANAQRQTLYSQALSQIVANAVSEMTGGNQALGSIATMQMSQSQQAQQAAAQTAELALLLGGG